MKGLLEMSHPDFLVIGHVTKDLQEDGYTIGGTVTFASLTAHNLGQRTAVITRASPDLSLNPLYQGIEVLHLPSPATSTFQNLYSTNGTRTQFLRAVAGPIKAEDVPPAWREAKTVLLGPLTGELEGSIVKTFPHSLIGVTPQGWMRRWDEEGRVFPKPWEEAAEVLTCARVVIFSEKDVGRDENVIQAYARMADTLVVTHGPGGATVYHRGEARRLPAFATIEIDPTGAGDVFAAAYLIELERSGDPYAAAHFANCVASFTVEKPGAEGIPTLEQVEQRLAQFPLIQSYQKSLQRRDKNQGGQSMKALVLTAKWEPREGYEPSEFEKATGKAVTGSAIWRYPELKVQEVERPAIEPDQVLIQVKACGVCGSDMHFYETDDQGYILYPGLTKFPTILGHEFSGRVVEVGSDVQDLEVGDMVTAEEMIWCGHCFPCRNGFPNHCTNLEEIGFTIPGAFAEYIAIGAKYCWKLNALMDRYGDEDKVYEAGAIVEPSSVAYNAVFERAGGFRPGAYVVVYGLGPIGLAVAAECKASGAAKVIGFELSANRRELAKKVGADYVFDPREVTPSEVVMDLTEGQGADLHVEAAGAPQVTVPEMEKSLAINGKIAQVGRAATRVPMYLETLQVRRGQVFGSQGHSGHAIFPGVIRLMASGLIDMTQIITARYSLDETVDAIAQSVTREDGKIMVKP